jgi:hypothetical protein
MKQKSTIIALTVILLIGGCAGQNRFMVTPVGNEPASSKGRLVYSLPQTILEVKIDYQRNTFLPGPYRKYSEKLLGITQVINEEKTEWEITGASVIAYSEPDPDQYYSINILKGDFSGEEFLKLTSSGLVIDPMGLISSNTLIPAEGTNEIPSLMELNLKKSHREVSDTLYKTVIKDSSFVKVPILRKQKEAKTIDQRAEEAANLIIKIRKRRMKLLDGEYNIFPEGQALEVSVRELNELEKEYLALFTGKVITEKFCHSYFVEPSGTTEKSTLMRFSVSTGALSPEAPGGQPVSLEVNPLPGMPVMASGSGKEQVNTLFYRMPGICRVQVLNGTDLIWDSRISLFQAGNIVSLPVNRK